MEFCKRCGFVLHEEFTKDGLDTPKSCYAYAGPGERNAKETCRYLFSISVAKTKIQLHLDVRFAHPDVF